MQIDLSGLLKINQIRFEQQVCNIRRDSNRVFVQLPRGIKSGETGRLEVYYQGKPRVAKKAPWDGGFVWSRDSSGMPWIGVACEGVGASVWMPCKDVWNDEPDSIDVRLEVPKGLTGVSNGKLMGVAAGSVKDYEVFHWKVSNPINHYSITVNVGNYAHLTDSLTDINGTQIKLDYYVLKGNEEKALHHFKQVGGMLTGFGYYFGPYPFSNDGYKLVEAPYWGMEHQSCVAYGNQYKNNSFGFDFIIIHESGHEWFANSITADDPAEMWIHESFTTYSEALYVEYFQGYERSLDYLNTQKGLIVNKVPMVGPRGVNFHNRSDNDIYYKGTWMLHTMRNVLNNDSIWFRTLKGFALKYQKQIINTATVLAYFNEATGRSWDAFFRQYLYGTNLPLLEYKFDRQPDGTLVVRYRMQQAVKGLEMQLQVTVTKGRWDVITPQQSWQLLDLNYFDEQDFKIRRDAYLIEIRKLKQP